MRIFDYTFEEISNPRPLIVLYEDNDHFLVTDFLVLESI
ncbi:hypothetical protein UFOVP1394_90, partial [uncultured Caudovirales phage]